MNLSEEFEVETPEVVTAPGAPVDGEAALRVVCEAADEQKAHDIVVLDVRGQTIVADFFVVCSGTSTTHIQSIAERVQDRMREQLRLRAKAEGDATSFWMILDYGDVLLHVFDEGTREFYDLERLWADAKVSHWPEGEVRQGVTTDTTGDEANAEANVEANVEANAEAPSP